MIGGRSFSFSFSNGRGDRFFSFFFSCWAFLKLILKLILKATATEREGHYCRDRRTFAETLQGWGECMRICTIYSLAFSVRAKNYIEDKKEHKPGLGVCQLLLQLFLVEEIKGSWLQAAGARHAGIRRASQSLLNAVALVDDNNL